jgi:hypothetical protein
MANDDDGIGTALSPELESLISDLPDGGDNAKSEDDAKEVDKAGEEEKPEDKTDEPEEDGEGERDSEDEEKGESDDEGYVIDDDEEEVVPEEKPTNSTEENKTNPNLTPEDQYVLQGLTPVKISGKVGDKDVEVDIYSTDQLPAGFKYADDASHDRAIRATQINELTARERQADYRNQQTQKAAKEFKEAEDASDRADIGELQRSGDIPKFKANPTSKEWDSDPANQLVQAVLDFKEKENQKYIEDYNAGKKAYRHIGFEEAYYKYQRLNPAKTRSEAEKNEDKERKQIASRTNKTAGTSSNKADKDDTRITSTRDLFGYIDSLGWE